MERLTKPDWKSLFSWECCGQTDFCLRGRDKEKECVNCIVPKLYARVAMFEDAGVPMQKIIWMKEVIEEAFDNDTSRIERAHELHVADKEGRVVVLPRKVYETDGVRVYEHAVRGIIYRTAGGPDFDESTIGKSIFLTREEAERALGRNGNEEV